MYLSGIGSAVSLTACDFRGNKALASIVDALEVNILTTVAWHKIYFSSATATCVCIECSG